MIFSFMSGDGAVGFNLRANNRKAQQKLYFSYFWSNPKVSTIFVRITLNIFRNVF